ncbi:hypothetical protein ACHAP8_011262 [Fusarium lateritium]
MDDERMTPMLLSAAYGNIFALSKLVEKGADINEIDRRGSSATPLHIASARGHTKFVEKLLQLNAQVDARTSYQRTPLHYATENADTHIVDLLIKYGADVNAANNGGETALTEVALNGDRSLVNIFVGEGATINDQAILIAEEQDDHELVVFLRRTRSLQHTFEEHIPAAWAHLVWKASLGRLLREKEYCLQGKASV